jgi:hypothetical protein
MGIRFDQNADCFKESMPLNAALKSRAVIPSQAPTNSALGKIHRRCCLNRVFLISDVRIHPSYQGAKIAH